MIDIEHIQIHLARFTETLAKTLKNNNSDVLTTIGRETSELLFFSVSASVSTNRARRVFLATQVYVVHPDPDK